MYWVACYGYRDQVSENMYFSIVLVKLEQWMRGDFNVIRKVSEEFNGNRIKRVMSDFDGFIRESELVDPPLFNAKFTWSNLQENLVCCRLDRFLFSLGWEMFPNAIELYGAKIKWVADQLRRAPKKAVRVFLGQIFLPQSSFGNAWDGVALVLEGFLMHNGWVSRRVVANPDDPLKTTDQTRRLGLIELVWKLFRGQCFIKPKSKHIWIDHCSLCDYDDGLIDITRESTDITISRFGKIYSQCNIYEAGQKKVAFKYLTEKFLYVASRNSSSACFGWYGKVFKSHLFGSPTIVSTDAEVESMIYGREVNPDLVQVEKAKAILMEHEVAILEVLAKLADVSDGDGSPKQFQYHDSQKELQRIGRGMATQKDLYGFSSLDDWEDTEGIVEYMLSSSEGQDSDGEVMLNPLTNVDLPTAREQSLTTNDTLGVFGVDYCKVKADNQKTVSRSTPFPASK
ncbi:hypothetical protein ACSBR2_015574 [Camellia fascicularis]